MNHGERLKPLCFVLMPFGHKPDGKGGIINFDSVYDQIIQPAIQAAELEPLRADEEKIGGIIHKPMFERLILCDYAVADLTTANANVFYELGIRHGVRPHATTAVFACETRLPFDVTFLRGVPYRLRQDGTPQQASVDSAALGQILVDCKGRRAVDSPLFQLLNGMNPPEIAHLKTDVFREQVEYSHSVKKDLRDARKSGKGAVRAILSIQERLGEIKELEAGVAIDLLLSFRAVDAWREMIELADALSEVVSQTILVREQYAWALNRLGRCDEAEQVLQQLILERGASSETNGILGRVYKDRWERARDADDTLMASAWLVKAIEAYCDGFNADIRDAFPGINAVTLMEMLDQPDPRQTEMIPVVRYSVQRQLQVSTPQYWNAATMLELEVLARNESRAIEWLMKALPLLRHGEVWMGETTARNLRLIREVNEARGHDVRWIESIEGRLSPGS